MNKGLSLWERAKEIIPGGNGLLSKRPERFLPDLWPTYYDSAKGINVKALDGETYQDFAQMSIGCGLVGYGNDIVNQRVLEAIRCGVSTTLNCPEEVELGERLLQLTLPTGMVRFARTGGEAMAVAIRLARAAVSNEIVAFSGYHGWSDWYLSANLQRGDNLDGHLLPGLIPRGVPRSLSGTVIPFKYNDLDDLTDLLDSNPDCKIVVVEGARFDCLTNEFIAGLNELKQRLDLIVISDEITSGFRACPGSIAVKMGLEADLLVFGKAIGGGFALSCVVGAKDLMLDTRDTFISSSMWTERVGFCAGLGVLDVISDSNFYPTLLNAAKQILDGWERCAKNAGLKLTFGNFLPLASFRWSDVEDSDAMTTFFIQEMLARGYLASTSVYVSGCHEPEMVHNYVENVQDVFTMLNQHIETGTLKASLRTRTRSDSFGRIVK